MKSENRNTRILYLIFLVSSCSLLLLGVGWALNVSAYNLPESAGTAILPARSPEGILNRPVLLPTGNDALWVEGNGDICSTPLTIVDSAMLDLCIQQANAVPGTDTLGLAADVTLTGTLTTIDSEIVILGNGYNVDGSNSYRVFEVTGFGRLELLGITIQHGSAGEGGAIRNAGVLDITDSWILSSTATSGGGIYNVGGASTSLTGSTLENNHASIGGGIYISDTGSIVILNSTQLISNTAVDHGGGIYMDGGATADIISSTFQSNTAKDGGGIYSWNGSSAVIISSTFQANSADEGGGIHNALVTSTITLINTDFLTNTSLLGSGIFNRDGSTIDLSGGVFQGNSGSAGGGIYNLVSIVEVNNTQFISNSGTFGGGGIYNQGAGAVLRVSGATFQSNSSSGDGGGAINNLDSAIATLTNTLIVSNTASFDGGGINNTDVGIVRLVGGTLRANHAANSNGGAIFNSDVDSVVFLSGTLVLNNSADLDGGGIHNADGGSAVLSGGIIQGNSATSGGGIYLDESASVIISGTQIISNTAAAGGGGLSNLSEATAILTGVQFIDNAAGAYGGAINTASIITLTNSFVITNTAQNGGGGLFSSGSTVTMNGLVFDDNSAPAGAGGGIHIASGVLSLSNSTIQLNISGGAGGGIYLTEGVTANIYDSELAENNAAGSGGGLFQNAGTLRIQRSDISSNTSDQWGGGIWLFGGSTEIAGSTLSANKSSIGGGGIVAIVNSVIITNSTIANNIGDLQAGGINSQDTSMRIVNSTISQNSAPAAGGILNLYSGGSVTATLALTHTTVTGNSPEGLLTVDNTPARTPASNILTFPTEEQAFPIDMAQNRILVGAWAETFLANSIIANHVSGDCVISGASTLLDATGGFNMDSDGTCISGGGPSNITGDPLLGPLQNNGGDTWTQALSYDSPALDWIPHSTNGCGTSIVEDQRGVSRPQGASCDVGAYEVGLYALSVAKDGTGSGSVVGQGIDCGIDCSESYPISTFVTLTAIADTGSTFDGWGGACTGTGVCSVTMTETKTVSATFTLNQHLLSTTMVGNGSGSFTSEPDGIDCPGDCSELYNNGTVVTLTAISDVGSTFNGWSGSCVGSGICTVTMTAAMAVTATFTLDQHLLTVSTDGNGSGSVNSIPAGIACPGDCTELFNFGTSVTLTASAGTGSTLTGWDGTCTGTGQCVVSMTAARNVTATFTLDQYLLTVGRDGTGSGSVNSIPAGIDCPADCTELFDYATAVTLTASAGTGSTFTGWVGTCTGMGPCVVSMTAARNVTATFTLDQYLLTVGIDGTGSGNVTSNPAGIDCPADCTELFEYGMIVTLTASASSGSTFTGWSGACSGQGDCVIAMTEIRDVTATFVLDDYLVFLPLIIR
ncbi:MAG TPA: choice-of-anchor Q domain-containing protein [candidate division Zixibacteria bacterium]|nr:choice-of-anchor Q domain-containing protein [candidate division Zixibacteria bacterium]